MVDKLDEANDVFDGIDVVTWVEERSTPPLEYQVRLTGSMPVGGRTVLVEAEYAAKDSAASVQGLNPWQLQARIKPPKLGETKIKSATLRLHRSGDVGIDVTWLIKHAQGSAPTSLRPATLDFTVA